MRGITLSNGNPLELEKLNPVVGYQLRHKDDDSFFPYTDSSMVYSKKAIFSRMEDAVRLFRKGMFDVDIVHYNIVEVFESETDEHTDFIKE